MMKQNGTVLSPEEENETKLPRRIASVLKAVAGKPDPKYFTSAVIVAAG